MQTKTTYIADDGSEFEREDECEQYELDSAYDSVRDTINRVSEDCAVDRERLAQSLVRNRYEVIDALEKIGDYELDSFHI